MAGVPSATADTPHDRLGRILTELYSILHDPHSITHSTPPHARSLELVSEAKAIVDGHDEYHAAHSAAPHPALAEMLAASAATDWKALKAEGKTQFELIPSMSAGGYEAVVLAHFARMAKARSILEVGMFIGTTTLALASIPAVERVVTLELEPFLKEHNARFFEAHDVAHKIDVRIGDAKTSLAQLGKEGAQFDMVFIDADKPSYLTYYLLVRESNLLAPGGFIAVDNTAYKASPWVPDHSQWPDGHHIHTFNEVVRTDQGVEAVMLSIEDGITLIRRKGE